MKHTKGPWYISQRNGKDFVWTLENGTNPVAQVFGVYSDCESKLNADLIACSPDLLAGLKSAILYIETYGGEVTSNFAGKNNENLTYYKNLIAKAEGQD